MLFIWWKNVLYCQSYGRLNVIRWGGGGGILKSFYISNSLIYMAPKNAYLKFKVIFAYISINIS